MVEGSEDSKVASLLQRLASGDTSAVDELLLRYRDRLKRMVAVRMDRRIAQRVDESDIVQETLINATRKLPEFLKFQRQPFYPWLRQLAWEQVVQQHRRHIGALGRTVRREDHLEPALPDHSAMDLAHKLVAAGTNPSGQAMRQEMQQKVRQMLARLKRPDREVLVLRYLEQLSTRETAAVLGLTDRGVKTRQRRALERLTQVLNDDTGG